MKNTLSSATLNIIYGDFRDFQEYVPEFYVGVSVSSEEDLLFLGKLNLNTFISYWQEVDEAYKRSEKVLDGFINLLSNNTQSDFYKMKEQYEFPDFPETKLIDGPYAILAPTDKESLERRAGTTTLNCCGWCRFHNGGIGQADCMLKTSCALIPNQIWGYTMGASFLEEENLFPLTFDSPCLLWKDGAEQWIDAACIYHRRKLMEVKKERALNKKKIKYLKSLLKKAEEKPYIPILRPYDWFKYGDEVVCFVHGEDKIVRQARNKFVKARIFRENMDDVVVVYTYDVATNSDFMDGHGVIYGLARPELLKTWEYEYLKAHTKYLSLWLGSLFGMPIDDISIISRLRDELAPIVNVMD